MNTRPTCLSCDSPDLRCRGLCVSCYRRFYSRVRANKDTWEKMEKSGLCHKPNPPNLSRIEAERQETAFYLRVVWPEICGEAATHHSISESQTPP